MGETRESPESPTQTELVNTPTSTEQKERELERPIPRGFDDFAVEATGLNILDLGKLTENSRGNDMKANNMRLTLRRMPQKLHESVEFELKPLLPVDEEYKKELFSIVSGTGLPATLIQAVDRFVEKMPEEYARFIKNSEVVQGLPQTYQKVYFTLPGYIPYYNEFFQLMPGIFRTVQTDLANLAYAKFLLREISRRSPAFKPEDLGDVPSLLKSGSEALDLELQQVDIPIPSDVSDTEGIPAELLDPEKYIIGKLSEADLEAFRDPEAQKVLRAMTVSSLQNTNVYQEMMKYTNLLQQYLLKQNPALAEQLADLKQRKYSSSGFELLGMPYETPMEQQIWEKVQAAIPPGFLTGQDIKLEYDDALRWRNYRDDHIVPPNERDQFAAYYGGEKQTNRTYLTDGEVHTQESLILYRSMIDKDIKANLRAVDLPQRAVAVYSRVAIHELFEAWVANQPKEFIDELFTEISKDEIGINDQGGVLERSAAVKEAYNNTGGIILNEGKRHHWEIEQVVESITAYNIFPEQTKAKHPNAYRAVSLYVYHH